MGSLFGGDLRESDGFIWSRGGMEGLVYLVPSLAAIGILAGTGLIVLGLFGIILQRKRGR